MKTCLRKSCVVTKTKPNINQRFNNGYAFLINLKILYEDNKWGLIVKKYEEIRNDPLLKIETDSFDFYGYILEAYSKSGTTINIVKFVKELQMQGAILKNDLYMEILHIFDYEQVLNQSYDFLEWLRKNKKILINQELYEKIMFTYLKLENTKKVKEVIEEIYINKIALCNNSLFLILDRYFKSGYYESILELYPLLNKQPFDLRISAIFIRASGYTGNSIVSWEQFLMIKEKNYPLNKKLIINVLTSCEKNADSSIALKIFDIIKNLKIPLDVDIYRQIILTFQQKDDYPNALRLLIDMEQDKIEIDINMYNAILALARDNLDWGQVNNILIAKVFKNNITLNLKTCDIAADYCLSNHLCKFTELDDLDGDFFIEDANILEIGSLLEQIKINNIEPNVSLYIKLIRSLYMASNNKINTQILKLVDEAMHNKEFAQHLCIKQGKLNHNNYILDIPNNEFLSEGKRLIFDDFVLVIIAYHLNYLQNDCEILVIYNFDDYNRVFDILNKMFNKKFIIKKHDSDNNYLITTLKKQTYGLFSKIF